MFARGFIVCCLLRVNGVGYHVLQNMMLADYHGIVEVGGYPVVSVRAADQRKWIILSLDPGSSELLKLWVRTFRGPLPGDNNPTSAYVFGTDNGSRCTSIHKYMERFAEAHYFVHYTLATVQAVWRGTAHLSGEQEVKDAVEEGLVPSPFESVDGED